MTDYSELKRLIDAATPGKWFTDGERTVIAGDSDQLNKGWAVAECHGPDDFRNARFIAAANPAAVLALIAENETLAGYLCTCRDCGGEGELHTGKWHYYGHMDPPEPAMEKCGECDGTGLLGEIQDLYQVITERDQLKAEVETLRKDAARLDRLDMECEGYGTDIHEGNRWVVDGPFATVRDAIDAAMANDQE